MRISSLAVLSFVIFVGGFAPLASADPGAPNGEAKGGGWKKNIEKFLSGNKENKGKSDTAGIHNSSNYQQTPLTQNSPTQSVPVPGTLLLFGGGFGAFAVWHQRLRRG